MGHEEGDPHARDPHPPDGAAEGPAGDGPDGVAYTVGGLLIELGEKIRRAGADGVRILTDDELQRDQLAWFRAGWTEHARATSQDQPEHPDRGPGQHPDSEGFPVPPARLLHFPDRQNHPDEPRPRYPEDAQEHRQPDELRLPIVGAGEARVRDLMPHRPRLRRGRNNKARGDPPDGEPG